MGRFVVAVCAALGSAQLQLFAAPAPGLTSLQTPQVLAPAALPAEAFAGGYGTPAFSLQPEVAAEPASGSQASQYVAASLFAGAAVFALCHRSSKARAIESADVLPYAYSRRAGAPSMIIDPSHAVDTVNAASTLVADGSLSIPIPAFSPGKSFIMISANLATIFGMTIQGKGLSKGMQAGMSPKEAHDDMVNSFGLTWLLSGTAFGHVLGAGAILGCEAGGLI